jgi:hypothetical protein
MSEESAVVPAELVEDRRRNAALMRAIGLDKLSEAERELALAIAKKYELDLLLGHARIIEGRLYVSRDGLLWIAHRSGVLDGIEVTEPVIVKIANLGEFWHCTASVYRRDMQRPFVYPGRYPTTGKNRTYAPEMAIARAESMALRRAFNVSAPTVDERWDLPTVQADVDAVSVPQQPPRTLAERVAERRQTVGPPAVGIAAGPSPDEDDEVTQAMGVARLEEDRERKARLAARINDEIRSQQNTPPTTDDIEACGDEDSSPMALGMCDELPGHKGPHRSENGTWPARSS